MTTKIQPLSEKQLLQLKMEQMKLLEAKLAQQARLPHLYGQKFYAWQREFFESDNKICLLTAANQIGKSTIQIRRNIEWATNKLLWPKLWPGRRPRMGWYLYPTKEVANVEWETKWKPLMPPSDDPEYGWKEHKVNGKIDYVQFNTGVMIVFKVYAQNVTHLQTGTCDWISCDEELPYELYNELVFRISASNGYFSMVFTATLGQEFWRLAMEPKEDEIPRFPSASKWQISLYDCQFFEDGAPSHWTAERIAQAVARCGTENEILKRIYGKFVVTGGRTYEAYTTAENTKEPHPTPRSWLYYAGIDSGSGGDNDPAAIVFVAVSPNYQEARVIKAWRGDDVITTSTDIVNKFLEMQGTLKMEAVFYDYSDKDLHTIASRMDIGFTKANKDREFGQGTLNSLFKNKMLYLYRDGDILLLAQELSSLQEKQTKPVDHLADALRYACALIPWDWSIVKLVEPPKEELKVLTHDERRRERHEPEAPREYTVEDEFDEWNSYLE